MRAKPHTILYGGSFDPIHVAHLRTTAAAMAALGAERLLFIPAQVSPHKARTAAPAADRLEMIRLAIADNPALGVSDVELLRPPLSYTIDTVTALQGQYPGERFTLLMGADQLPRLHTWHRVGELLAMVEVAILRRPGVEAGGAEEALRANLGEVLARQVMGAVLDTPLMDVSSTEIRRRVAAGESIEGLVPAAVGAYIAARGLYRVQ